MKTIEHHILGKLVYVPQAVGFELPYPCYMDSNGGMYFLKNGDFEPANLATNPTLN